MKRNLFPSFLIGAVVIIIFLFVRELISEAGHDYNGNWYYSLSGGLLLGIDTLMLYWAIKRLSASVPATLLRALYVLLLTPLAYLAYVWRMWLSAENVHHHSREAIAYCYLAFLVAFFVPLIVAATRKTRLWRD